MLYRPTNAAIGKVALLAGALLAILLLAYFLQNSAFAQDAGSIEYAENGIEPVATFTGTDPEGRTVYWSVLPDDAFGGIEGIDQADAADADHFSISMDGVLSFNSPPDYEVPMGGADNTYKVVVVASDDAPGAGAGDATKMGYKKVTVNVTDEDEPGMVSLSAQQPQVNVALTAILTDDDATDDQITDPQWMWEHSSAANGPWTPILTATTNSYSPLGVADKYLRVTVTYTDEHGSDKSESAVSAHMVRAEPDAANAAPVFPTGSGARNVDENSPPGTNVGKRVAAKDVAGDRLTYTLTGSDLFVIDPATGQITVAPAARLNADIGDGGIASYDVTVTATDPWGAEGSPSGATSVTVTITINNVNEAPVITGGATRIVEHAENIAITTALNSYMATDVDQNDVVDWSVSGTDAGDFEISAAGALTFKEAPDYEMPADSNRDNVYMVTVVATDAGVDSKNKMTAERAVVITVTNVEEAGRLP